MKTNAKPSGSSAVTRVSVSSPSESRPEEAKNRRASFSAHKARGGLPAIYLKGASWVASIKRSSAEQQIGLYPSARLAAEATLAYLTAAEGLCEELSVKEMQLCAPPSPVIRLSSAPSDARLLALCRSAILSSKNQSGFQGVNKSSRSGHWEAAIQESGKRRFLGCFPSAEAAALAYAKEFARLGQVCALSPTLLAFLLF